MQGPRVSRSCVILPVATGSASDQMSASARTGGLATTAVPHSATSEPLITGGSPSLTLHSQLRV